MRKKKKEGTCPRSWRRWSHISGMVVCMIEVVPIAVLEVSVGYENIKIDTQWVEKSLSYWWKQKPPNTFGKSFGFSYKPSTTFGAKPHLFLTPLIGFLVPPRFSHFYLSFISYLILILILILIFNHMNIKNFECISFINIKKILLSHIIFILIAIRIKKIHKKF